MSPRVLILAYGNPGRRDDGLGPALAAAVEGRVPRGVTIEADYQLTVEDAALLAEHDVVIFVDADVSCAEPFSFSAVAPGPADTFSTHSVSPGGVLTLARELFGAHTEAYALGIRGYEFNEFGGSLSEAAGANLAAATSFLCSVLENRNFREAAAEASRADATAAASKGEYR